MTVVVQIFVDFCLEHPVDVAGDDGDALSGEIIIDIRILPQATLGDMDAQNAGVHGGVDRPFGKKIPN